MMDFARLPPGPLTLTGLQAPTGPIGGALRPLSLTLPGEGAPQVIDLGGAITLPGFVDMHTHLDKGHIWPRAPNPDGSFFGALWTVEADRRANWSAPDVRRRMEFALRCAHAHGTVAIRTHLDSASPQDDISFGIFREVQADWRGRIAFQAASLDSIDRVTLDGEYAHTADLVAATPDAVLGCVTYPIADLEQRLDWLFQLAEARDLPLDFHADETHDTASNTLRAIAETAIRRRFARPIVVGHCCSLAMQPEAEADRTMDLVAEARLNVVSLPMCNMYLQDRQAGRTPRWRGVTLVHELAARGVNVSFASDNTRDPFYAYGDLDMLEVMREATRIAHLDHCGTAFAEGFSANPARACGFATAPDDLVICNARSWTELLARPQTDRIVIRGGRQIDRTLPDYRDLQETAG